MDFCGMGCYENPMFILKVIQMFVYFRGCTESDAMMCMPQHAAACHSMPQHACVS